MQLEDIFIKVKEKSVGRAFFGLVRSDIVYKYILPAMLAFFLSRAVMLCDAAPFGLCVFAAYARGRRAAVSLGAAVLGYLTLAGEMLVHRYIIALGVIFIINAALGKRRLHAAARPIIGAGALFLPSFLLWALLDMSAASLLRLSAECALCALGVYFFSEGLSAIRCFRMKKACGGRAVTGFLFLMSAFFFSLSRFDFDGASPGLMLSFAAALLISASGAWGAGALSGVMFGLFLSLSDKSMAGVCVVCPAAAVLCGVLAGIKRPLGTVCAFLFSAAAFYYFFAPHEAANMTLCALAGAAAATLCPAEALVRIRDAIMPKNRGARYDKRMRELVCDRLWRLAEGYRDVCDAVYAAHDRIQKTNLNNIATVFEMTGRRACRTCVMLEVCWQERYSDTIDALNAVTGELSKKKTVYEEDFPPLFRTTCLHIDIFTEALNDAYRDWLMRRKLAAKLRRERRLTLRHYSSLSGAMTGVAREFSHGIGFNIEAEEKIIEYLGSLSVYPRSVIVMEREGGRVSAELDFFESETLCLDRDALRREASFICGVSLSRVSVSRRGGILRITMSVPEPLSPVYACFGAAKEGERESGDMADAFKTDKGKLVLGLCDGMGSGTAAAADARIAAGVIRRIITAGFDSDTAVAVLNSAMMLKSDEESVTAVDISVIDLYTGRCEFLKLGAAPTYVLKGGRVIRIDPATLPAGVLEEAQMHKSTLTLERGDIIVMVSDGVLSAGDAFLCDMLKRFEYYGAHHLAREIVRCARNSSPEAALDDMSALVCII
ncbi:MAG: SpoIIE family protein phosphatase [Clostridia bacterium]|nr:SpoIIE family protein phosphatase [Clostridia bacterium]